MPDPINNADKAAAHALWTELATRIATQRLHYRSGEEETAAESIYKVFGAVRQILSANADAKAFEILALRLLNDTLRPNTARWHGWMTEDHTARDENGKQILKFKDAWVRRQFRRELQALQPRLAGFVKALEAMKMGDMPEAWLTCPDATQLLALARACRPRQEVQLGKDIPSGIQEQVRFTVSKPREKEIKAAGLTQEQAKAAEAKNQEELTRSINKAERDEILRRRGRPGDGQVTNATAMAFSGGGIRSATFCLGITQVLARRGLLPQFDYLSTVSGGGYFGSFLSAYLGTGGDATPGNPAKRVEQTFIPAANQREPRALRHLRNHSRYLVDDGFRRKSVEVGIVAAGILFNLLIVMPLPLIGALLTVALFYSGFLGNYNWMTDSAYRLPDPAVYGGVVMLLFVELTGALLLVYPSLKAQSLKELRKKGRSSGLSYWMTLVLISAGSAVILFLCWLIPLELRAYHWLVSGNCLPWLAKVEGRLDKIVGVLGLSLATLVGAVALRLKKQPQSWKALKYLAILCGPLLYLVVYFWAAHHMFPLDAIRPDWNWRIVLIVASLMVLWAWLLVDVNTYSPHGYYRDRLSVCYLRSPKEEDPTQDEPVDRLRLSELNVSTAAPYHLLNATVNLPSSTLREMRGRNGDFFMMSKHYCGSPMCGYYPTKELEEADPHFDLGTALAISGAAASSNMGWQTDNSIRLVMTIANVRLGYWLRNPLLGAEKTKTMSGPGPLELFFEMFASGMNENGRYLNLSDGGHIENLAAYELLRRRAKFIVCVDGGMEPDLQCRDLLRLERYASIDLGITMHYDLTDLFLLSTGFSQAYGVLVKIDYRPPQNETERRQRNPKDAEWGWMLYIKLAMIGYGPGFVMDYRRDHPDFPHQTTADQIYDEAQFEAYRALGEAAAESFFTRDIIDGYDVKSIRGWFTALAANLLPDNDEAFQDSPAVKV